MGEMTIRNIDDALLVELSRAAERRGTDLETLARDLLNDALRGRRSGRADVARAIVGQQDRPSEIDSVDLLREDRESR